MGLKGEIMKKNGLKAIFLSIFAIICLGMGISSCSDDSPTVLPPVENDPFFVEFWVVDTAGEPVEGIQITLYNDHDYLQKSANKAVNKTRFSLAAEARAILYVMDVEGDTVRTLVHGVLPAGVHEVTWNGLDDGGFVQYSGRYEIHLRLYEDGTTVSYADSMGVLMSQPDSDFYFGTTYTEGNIGIDDKRLFPQLYSLPDMMAVDENGTDLGSFNVTGAMHAIYKDPIANITLHTMVNVVAGANVITQVWDPLKASPAHPGSFLLESAGSEKPPVKSIPIPDLVDGLLLAYPNPFN